MKIRTGFVSNSSSSSFVCEVCGSIRSGWDWDLKEAGMLECRGGHTLCEEHRLAVSVQDIKPVLLKDFDGQNVWSITDDLSGEDRARYIKRNEEAKVRDREKIAIINEYDGDDTEELLQEVYEGEAYECLPVLCCPICQLQKVTDEDMLKYVLATRGLARDEVAEQLREKFCTQAALYKEIKRLRGDER